MLDQRWAVALIQRHHSSNYQRLSNVGPTLSSDHITTSPLLKMPTIIQHWSNVVHWQFNTTLRRLKCQQLSNVGPTFVSDQCTTVVVTENANADPTLGQHWAATIKHNVAQLKMPTPAQRWNNVGIPTPTKPTITDVGPMSPCLLGT